MKKTKILSLVVAACILLPLAFYFTQLRIRYAEIQVEKTLIQHLSGFLNSVDQQLFVFSAIPNSQSRLFERMQNQLNVFESTFTGRKYFSIELRDGKPYVFISSNKFPNYLNGSYYPLPDDVIEKVFKQSAPLVISSFARDSSKKIRKVFVPMLGNEQQAFKMVAVLELDEEEVSRHVSNVRVQTLIVSFIFIIVLLLMGSFVLYREEQPLAIRQKYKHIETLALFFVGTWILIIFLFAYREHQRHEQKIIFEGYAENYATNLRNALRTMRHDLEQFSAFVQNSEQVDQNEFGSFAQQIMLNSAFDNFMLFESNTSSESPHAFSLTIDPDKQYKLRYNFNRIHNNGLLSNPDETMLKAMTNNLIESGKDFLVHGSDLIRLPDTITRRGFFILGIVVPPRDSMKATKENSRYIVATVDPQYLLAHTFRRNEWLKSTIAIGLTQHLGDDDLEWIAAYPKEHLAHHLSKDFQDHLKNYRFSQTFPVFIWGKTMGISAHSMPEFEVNLKGFSITFLAVSGSIVVLLITLLVFLIRQRWTIMENVIDNRTRNLDRRIKDLMCIRRVSDLLQSDQNQSQAFNAIIKELEFTLAVQETACVELKLNEEVFKTRDTQSACIVKLSQDILKNDIKVGWIALISCKPIQFQHEDKALLEQVSRLLSEHIEKEEFGNALKESELKFRSLVENAFDAIYTLEGKHFTYVNKAFCEMVGYDADELTSETFELEVLLTEKGREIVRRRFEDRQNGKAVPHRYEFQQLSKKGIVVDVEASTILVNIEGKQVIIGMLHDITERKRHELALKLSEEKLQQQNEELQVLNEELQDSNEHIRAMYTELLAAKTKAEASDKLKSAFLNNISHELRTPLNGILGAAAVIMEESNTPDERVEMAEVLKQSTDRLMRTIHQYVDISMLNSGAMPVHRELVNIRKLFQPLIEKSTQVCIAKKIKFDFELPGPEIETIFTDKNLLLKILDHLLDNAFKFTPKGGVSCSMKFVGSKLELIVRDTGVGIEESFKEHIYDLFMQEDVSNIRRYDGSGLGLPIVKKSCELLGAGLHFDSVKGVGTTFTVTLNHNISTDEKFEKKHNVMMSSKNEFPTLLIAEDEDSNFVVLNMLLTKRLNARVLRARDGAEAVQLCKTHEEIELVLMDIKMPVMDGYEATRHIKAFRPNLPVLAITAYGLTGDEHKAIASGCDDYMAKPIQTNQLLEKVKYWLEIS